MAYDQGKTLWISRQVIREFVAVLSRPQAFTQPSTPELIIERVRYFQERFEVADDSFTVTECLLQLVAEIPVGGKNVHDANIVATMMAYDIPELLTFNTKDFERYKKRILLVAT